MTRTIHRGLPLAFLAALLTAAALGGCKDFSFYGVLGDRIDDTPLAISPATVTVPMNGALTFTASGGKPPYSFAVVSGTGWIDAVTGQYSAPVTAGTDTVRVTDSKGRRSDAVISVTTAAGPLAINPATITMGPGGTLTFVATGGNPSPSYTFTLVASGSGAAATVDSATGAYQAGWNTGSDVIELADGVSAPVTATVTVTAADTHVDYAVFATSFPGTGTGGEGIPGGYDFTIRNNGSADGTQPVSWWVYLSDDGALGSGDLLLSSGSAAALAAAANSVPIPLTGTWPLAGGVKRLFVMVAADDDLTVDTAGPYAVTLSLPDINYSGTVAHTTGTTAGAGFTGSLTVANGGAADGVADLTWRVYASPGNSTIEAGDKLVAAGTIAGGLASGADSGALPFGNSWPTTPTGTWYLVADIQAVDDVNTANNQPSVSVTVNAPAAPAVNYSGVVSTGTPTRAGGAFNATLTVNNGPVAGGSTVHWSVYASLGNTTIEAGDKLVGSGSFAGLGAGGSSGALPIASTWPALTGDYYLVAQILADDETNPIDNTPASALITVGSTDYSGVVVHSSGTTAGAGFTGTLTISNIAGPQALAGSADIYWNVYASLGDTAISADDRVVASGTVAGGLGAGGSSGAVLIANSWQAAAGTYYLVADIFAGDDANTANNQPATANIVVGSVNYTVSVAHNTGTTANRAFNGSVTIANVGNRNGAAPLYWNVYASLGNTSIDAGDKLVASGTIGGGLAAGAGSGALPVSSTWPATSGTYFLVAEVAAADDYTLADNITSVGGIAVNAPNVDYTVLNVTRTGGVITPGGAVDGSFQYRNQGTDGGVQAVFWTAYASRNNTLDASDSWVASGSGGPLAAGATSAAVNFSGAWPLDYGSYYLLVAVSEIEDVNGANNQVPSGSTTAIGIYTDSEPNGDWTNMINVQDLALTLLSGMSVRINGTMNNTDADDVFRFNTGTVTSVTAAMSWGATEDIALYYFNAPGGGGAVAGVSITNAQTLSLTWTPDVSGAIRWLDLENSSTANVGAYTLILTAN